MLAYDGETASQPEIQRGQAVAETDASRPDAVRHARSQCLHRPHTRPPYRLSGHRVHQRPTKTDPPTTDVDMQREHG